MNKHTLKHVFVVLLVVVFVLGMETTDSVTEDLKTALKPAAKRRSRKRAVEQQHGGPDPAKVSGASARADRRVRSFFRWVHGGAEEDSHIT